MAGTLDFSRSFVTFTTPGRTNSARIQVEAVCDMAGGERYLLVASCKAENTYAEEDLFKQPNYDFCAIFGSGSKSGGEPTDYCIVRAGLPLTACWRDYGRCAEGVEETSIDLVEADARLCGTAREVVEATLDNLPLVGRTEMLDEAGETVAHLQYPIKTMNVNDAEHSPSGDWCYQVDTGPIAAPGLDRPAEPAIERLDLAFIAWHRGIRSAGSDPQGGDRSDEADLIALAPTQVNHSDDCVGHYSRVRTITARNEILVLD